MNGYLLFLLSYAIYFLSKKNNDPVSFVNKLVSRSWRSYCLTMQIFSCSLTLKKQSVKKYNSKEV